MCSVADFKAGRGRVAGVAICAIVLSCMRVNKSLFTLGYSLGIGLRGM